MLLLKLLAPIITLIIALYDLFEKKRTKKIKPQLWWKKPIIWVLFVASIISGLTIYFDNNAQDNLNKSNDMLLNNQKELQKQNDSLMTVVKNIDNKANNQKIISERAIHHEIQSTCPILVLGKITIKDEKYLADSTYAPKVTFIINNVGKREAYNFTYRIWVIPNNFSEIRFGDGSQRNNEPLTASEEFIADFYPRIKRKKLPIYFCIEIRYFDKEANKKHSQTIIREYGEVRGETSFYECDDKSRRRIITFINTEALPKIKP